MPQRKSRIFNDRRWGEHLVMPSDQIPESVDWVEEVPTWLQDEAIICFTDGSRKNGLSSSRVYCESLSINLPLNLDLLAMIFHKRKF